MLDSGRCPILTLEHSLRGAMPLTNTLNAFAITRTGGHRQVEWCRIVDAERRTREQMPYDEELARAEHLAVRFFLWSEPAVSLGFRQSPPVWLQGRHWQRSGIEWVERPTGGGMAFHGSDVSIAVVVPRWLGVSLHQLMRAVCASTVRLCRSYQMENIGAIEAPVAQGKRITYCLTQESPYAVYSRGRKIAGFALRRYRASWLIQGSVLAEPLPQQLREALPEDVTKQLAARAAALADCRGAAGVTAADAMHRWATSWSTWWEEGLLGALSQGTYRMSGDS